MAQLGGEFDETFHADAPPEVVRAHFSDLDAIIACTVQLDHAEKLDHERVRFVLQEQRQGVQTFRPTYVQRYAWEGDELVWRTVEGNLHNEGRARFVAAGGGTDIHYRHVTRLELPVPALVARMLQPVVQRILAPSVRAYVQGMIASLP